MSRHPLQVKTTCSHGGSRSTPRRYTWRTVCSLAIRGWRWRCSRRSDWTTSFANTCPAAARVLIGQAYVGAYVVLPPSPLPLADEIPIVDVREAGFLKWTLCHREYKDTRECPQDTLASLCHHPIEQSIANTIPSGFRQRHDLMFEFARELKTLPDLANATANDYKRYVRQWHETVEIIQLVGLCRELQRAADPENHFFLSARTESIC